MPDEKKRRRKPLAFNLGAEIEKARTRSGLSRRELSRLTGISRTVLVGYETGRTVPGAGELRLLCDALKISPNQFLYGREQPFKPPDGPLAELGLTDDDAAVIQMSLFFRMLSHDERAAILTLMHAVLEARHGKQKFAEAKNALKVIGEWVPELMQKVGIDFEKAMPPEFLANLEAEAKRRLQTGSTPAAPLPPKAKRKPSK